MQALAQAQAQASARTPTISGCQAINQANEQGSKFSNIWLSLLVVWEQEITADLHPGLSIGIV